MLEYAFNVQHSLNYMTLIRAHLTKKRLILIAILMIGLFFWIHHSFSPKKPVQKTTTAVTTTKVIQQDVVITAHAIGVVEPSQTVSIKSRVEGQLIKVGFKAGDNVKAGQVIFQIDSHPYEVALDQAKANLARSQALLDNYQKLLNRYAPLVKKGYISKQDYDLAEANVKSQKAALLADASTVKNAELNLSYCTIRAPISGRTGDVLVHEGNLIKMNDASPLVVINQVTPVYISFSLPEQQLEDIQKNSKEETVVTIDTKNKSHNLQAKLSFINNTVDPTTGMIQLKAVFANTQEKIWPGQYVDVTFPISQMKQALLVPTRAIQAGPNGAYVFVVHNDGHVSLQPIRLGAVVSDNTVVEGISANTLIVTTGQSQLVEGSLVKTTG